MMLCVKDVDRNKRALSSDHMGSRRDQDRVWEIELNSLAAQEASSRRWGRGRRPVCTERALSQNVTCARGRLPTRPQRQKGTFLLGVDEWLRPIHLHVSETKPLKFSFLPDWRKVLRPAVRGRLKSGRLFPAKWEMGHCLP